MKNWHLRLEIVVFILIILSMFLGGFSHFATKSEVTSGLKRVENKLERVEDLIHKILLKTKEKPDGIHSSSRRFS